MVISRGEQGKEERSSEVQTRLGKVKGIQKNSQNNTKEKIIKLDIVQQLIFFEIYESEIYFILVNIILICFGNFGNCS